MTPALRSGQGDAEAHQRAYIAGGLARLDAVAASHAERDRQEVAFWYWQQRMGWEVPALVARWITLVGTLARLQG